MSSIDTTAHVEDAEQIGCVDIGLQLSSGLFIPGDILSCIAWYLTINKAAMAMTVCQAFHHHLARRVWRDVSYVDGKLHNRFVPDSAWLRYGHLVRSLAIPSAAASDVVSQLMPNVATVSINLNNIDVDFFDEDPLEGLDNLRHVRIETSRADADVATAAIHWVARSEWSRNIDSVTWDVVYYWYPEELDILRLLLRESEYNPQRTLIDIWGYLEEFNAVQIGPFMPYFTSISLHASFMARCPSSDLAKFFAHPSLHFPRLRSLHLVLCCPNPTGGHPLPDFSPEMLPMLASLSIVTNRSMCSDSRGDIQHGIFEHIWPRVTELTIKGYLTAEDMRAAISCAPNTTSLTVSVSKIHLDLELVSNRMRHLRRLYIYGVKSFLLPTAVDGASSLVEPLVNLETLELHNVAVDVQLLTFVFILGTKLRSLVFKSTKVASNVIQHATKLAEKRPSSVFMLTLNYGRKAVASFDHIAVVSLFSNLASLILQDGAAEFRTFYQKHLPNISIL